LRRDGAARLKSRMVEVLEKDTTWGRGKKKGGDIPRRTVGPLQVIPAVGKNRLHERFTL